MQDPVSKKIRRWFLLNIIVSAPSLSQKIKSNHPKLEPSVQTLGSLHPFPVIVLLNPTEIYASCSVLYVMA
jgi:hypothetical protein